MPTAINKLKHIKVQEQGCLSLYYSISRLKHVLLYLGAYYAVRYEITANNVTPPYIHIPLPLDIIMCVAYCKEFFTPRLTFTSYVRLKSL